jgi:hypothetical protein
MDAAVGTSSSVAVLSPSSSCHRSPVVLVEANGDLGTRRPGSWACLADKDDVNGDKELALMIPLANKSSSPAAQPGQSSVGCEVEASGRWQEVLP